MAQSSLAAWNSTPQEGAPQVPRPIRKKRNAKVFKRKRKRQPTERQLAKRLARKIRFRRRAQKSYYRRKRAAKIAVECAARKVEREAHRAAWKAKQERRARDRALAEQMKPKVVDPAKPKRPTTLSLLKATVKGS